MEFVLLAIGIREGPAGSSVCTDEIAFPDAWQAGDIHDRI
jgi:hypothetical protein